MVRRTTWAPKPTDPWLSSSAWKTASGRLRAEWLRIFQAGGTIYCARCRKPIDLTLRHPHGGSLVVGHRIGRAQARRAGWTEAMAHDPSNLQPEHRACSQSAGAADGNRSPLRKLSTGQRMAIQAKVYKDSKISRSRKSWARQEDEIRKWYAGDE